ncbi:MAG: hypothetical protein ACJ763_07635 [Bdellovibrionia bacterium]
MIKAMALLCAVGLTILWIAGLGSPFSASWLTWLDGLCALIGYGIAFAETRARGPISLSIGLFALWIVGMATNGATWQNWWNFAFGCGYLLVGLLKPMEMQVASEHPVESHTSDHYRKSA